jgi:hypothetical protein
MAHLVPAGAPNHQLTFERLHLIGNATLRRKQGLDQRRQRGMLGEAPADMALETSATALRQDQAK